MSVVGCGFCSYAIRYHGEPEGTEPVEHVFCRLDKWREFEAENLTADRLEIEHDGIFFYADRCVRCNTFMFFNDRWKNIGTYTPNEEFSSAPMQEPFDFGPFWDDFLWFDITENSTPTAEVLTRYPQNLWLAKTNSRCVFTPTRRVQIASYSSGGSKSSRQSPSKQCRSSRSKKCLRVGQLNC